MADQDVSFAELESLAGGAGNAVVASASLEVLEKPTGQANAQVSFAEIEVLQDFQSNARVATTMIEVLCSIYDVTPQPPGAWVSIIT